MTALRPNECDLCTPESARECRDPVCRARGYGESAPATGDLREQLGRQVREVWVDWAREQPGPKPSWLVPWEELAEPDREVDRRIGEALYNCGLEVVAPLLAAKQHDVDWTNAACDAAGAAVERLEARVAELTRERSPAWLSGWKSALVEVDAWAQRHAARAEQHGDEPAAQAFQWFSTFAILAISDPTAPGRLADRADLQSRAKPAGEAGEPPAPRVVRVWQGKEMPPAADVRVMASGGAILVCDDIQGEDTPRNGWTWHIEGKPEVYAPWWQWVREAGPLTEVVSGVPSESGGTDGE